MESPRTNSTGKVVTITGVVHSIPSFYRDLYEDAKKINKDIFVPARLLALNNCDLEVLSIKVLGNQKGVTHISASICWTSKGVKGVERSLTDYFNCQDEERQWDYSEKCLFQSRQR